MLLCWFLWYWFLILITPLFWGRIWPFDDFSIHFATLLYFHPIKFVQKQFLISSGDFLWWLCLLSFPLQVYLLTTFFLILLNCWAWFFLFLRWKYKELSANTVVFISCSSLHFIFSPDYLRYRSESGRCHILSLFQTFFISFPLHQLWLIAIQIFCWSLVGFMVVDLKSNFSLMGYQHSLLPICVSV